MPSFASGVRPTSFPAPVYGDWVPAPNPYTNFQNKADRLPPAHTHRQPQAPLPVVPVGPTHVPQLPPGWFDRPASPASPPAPRQNRQINETHHPPTVVPNILSSEIATGSSYSYQSSTSRPASGVPLSSFSIFPISGLPPPSTPPGVFYTTTPSPLSRPPPPPPPPPTTSPPSRPLTTVQHSQPRPLPLPPSPSLLVSSTTAQLSSLSAPTQPSTAHSHSALVLSTTTTGSTSTSTTARVTTTTSKLTSTTTSPASTTSPPAYSFGANFDLFSGKNKAMI